MIFKRTTLKNFYLKVKFMKKRLDVLIFERGFAKSRNEALSLILNRKVTASGKIVDKAGAQIAPDAEITVEKDENNFASRGGYKILKGIQEFCIDLTEKVCLDIGASTGGFTDCMLKNGAKKVYSVDVGYGQLDWKLRNDPRVINIEKTNFRYWAGKEIQEEINFVSIDVSFISLKKILPNLDNLIKSSYEVLALIKPQFEVGVEKIGKNGVVRNQKYRDEVVVDLRKFIEDNGYSVNGVCESPIKGPAGNVEYLIYFGRKK